MKKHVLFLVPPKMFSYKKFADSVVSSTAVASSVPYGVLSIASYISHYAKNEIVVQVLDFSILPNSHEEITNKVRETIVAFKPDIVGISALFGLVYDSIAYFCDMIKTVDRSAITVAGGACAMNDYVDLLNDTKTLDAICYAEGEKAFLRLVDAEDHLAALENDRTWITRLSLADGVKPQADFIKNLDEIPFLNYGLVDYSKLEAPVDFNAFSVDKDAKRQTFLSIHSTRGCPFNCIFCAVNACHGKEMRYMSAEYTLSSIKHMIDEFGLTHLTFEDDQFLIDKKRAKRILKGIYDSGFNIKVCIPAVTVSFVDDELAALMKQIGIEKLTLAIEHGSEYVLKHIIEKPFTLPQLRNAVKALRDHDISPSCVIVTGLPGEKEEHRDETVQLIKELGIDWTSFHTATPFKGSRLYDICMEHGYVKDEDIYKTDMKHAVINTPDMSAEYITEKTYLMNLEVNFVHNYRMRIGDYKGALIWFNEVIRKYPDHGFAHYYLSKAYAGLNDTSHAQQHLDTFKRLVNHSQDWCKYAKHFALA